MKRTLGGGRVAALETGVGVCGADCGRIPGLIGAAPLLELEAAVVPGWVEVKEIGPPPPVAGEGGGLFAAYCCGVAAAFKSRPLLSVLVLRCCVCCCCARRCAAVVGCDAAVIGEPTGSAGGTAEGSSVAGSSVAACCWLAGACLPSLPLRLPKLPPK